MATRKSLFLLFLAVGFGLALLFVWSTIEMKQIPVSFNSQRAYNDLLAQVSFGPRTPGSIAHARTIEYIRGELETAGWKSSIQETVWDGFSIQNIIALKSDESPRLIIGAHYDSRLQADRDPGGGQGNPVLGANDGASGVAVLLELARTLPEDSLSTWLVFFDAEDNGGLDNRDWIMGSRAFVNKLTDHPQAVVIVDMVGDANLNIYIEHSSDPNLVTEIWAQAAKFRYGKYFISTPKYEIIDDHTPFLDAEIPAVDIIDFDYPYWHTSADTADKTSARSLQVVGETLLSWIASIK
jgi:Zn-dependent M28 family amino/carboxypeptidase